MQTGDIMRQWMLENYGKFNRGVGGSQTPIFILLIINILIVMVYYVKLYLSGRWNLFMIIFEKLLTFCC